MLRRIISTVILAISLVFFVVAVANQDVSARSHDELVQDRVNLLGSECQSHFTPDGNSSHAIAHVWLESNNASTGDTFLLGDEDFRWTPLPGILNAFVYMCPGSTNGAIQYRNWLAQLGTISLSHGSSTTDYKNKFGIDGYITTDVSYGAGNRSGVARKDVTLYAPDGGWDTRGGRYNINFSNICGEFQWGNDGSWQSCSHSGSGSYYFNLNLRIYYLQPFSYNRTTNSLYSIQKGTTAKFENQIYNDGSYASPTVWWNSYVFTLPSGNTSTIPSSTFGDNWPMAGSIERLNSADSGSITTTRGHHTNPAWSQNYSSAAHNVGDRICTTLRVKNNRNRWATSYNSVSGQENENWNQYRWSAPTCVYVVAPWRLEPATKVSASSPTRSANPGTITGRPDETITFTHTLINRDHSLRDDEDQGYAKAINIKGTVYQCTTAVGLTCNSGGTQVGEAVTVNGNGYTQNATLMTISRTTSVDANSSYIGKTICQYITADKTGYKNNNPITSTPSCVYIPYNYVTSVDVTGIKERDEREAGEFISIKQVLAVDKIRNTTLNYTYATKTIDGLTIKLICRVEKDSSVACPNWSDVTTSGNYNNDHKYTDEIKINGSQAYDWKIPPETEVGTQVCFQAMIETRGEIINGIDSNRVIKSNWKCVRIVKGPTLQIHGGESWSGENCTTKGKTYNEGGFLAKSAPTSVGPNGELPVSATWSQYGLSSNGSIDEGFGSGGHIANSDTSTVKELSNALKFASVDTNGSSRLGWYISDKDKYCVTDFIGYYEARFNESKKVFSGAGNIGDILTGSQTIKIGNKTVYWGGNGSTTTIIAGSANLTNQDLVMIFNGDVQINDNLVLYGNNKDAVFSNTTSLPNLTIVATGNIILNPRVQRLDGIYVAGGTFYDCKERPDNADISITGECGRQLIVNGAIIANQARFQRTWRGQSDGNYNQNADNIFNPTPAEIVSYPAAIWLQEYSHRQSISSGLRTILYRELAPRI